MYYSDVRLKEAQDKLIGAWCNADESLYFLFDEPKPEFNYKSTLIIKVKNELERRQYFIHFMPIGKLVIQVTTSSKFIESEKIWVEFIGNDIVEFTINSKPYTLLRMMDNLETVFELSE